MSNYQIAKEEADKIDNQIIFTLQQNENFRVEAGAGAGKTYSLNRVVDWLQENKAQEMRKKKQKIACITYTNAAVNVISSRLTQNQNNIFIVPSTIHSFAWLTIKQYQSTLISLVKSFKKIPKDCDPNSILHISYNLGSRYFDDETKTLYLYHNDVIEFFVNLLDNPKFRMLLTKEYPIILIDEYQDSFKSVIDKFILYFISQNTGPRFGFFGDSWQTIYSFNGACGEINHNNITVINKISNFRSPENIVNALNNIRPNLEQITAIDDYKGEAFVITNNDFDGTRQASSHWNGELPIDILTQRVNDTWDMLKKHKDWKENNSKLLMLTHRLLSEQQGYNSILEIIGQQDAISGEDEYIKLFTNLVEPTFFALKNNNTKELFAILGTNRQPILNKSRKKEWLSLYKDLEIARTKTIKDVLDIVCKYTFLPINPDIISKQESLNKSESVPYRETNLNVFESISYTEIINLIEFRKPCALYSTEHGVKGEEYDNVMFIVGRGWNQYRFDRYLPIIASGINQENIDSYERNRNLFYVCCSRPKKNLILFITFPVDNSFKLYLEKVFKKENILTYSDFMKYKNCY